MLVCLFQSSFAVLALMKKQKKLDKESLTDFNDVLSINADFRFL